MKPEFKPCKETPFLVEPGRFFHSMFYVQIPSSPDHLLGGNVTALLWRLDDEPNSWRITYRYRYYNSPDPHDKKDAWSWYVIHIPGKPDAPPQEFANRFKQVISYAIRFFFKDSPDLSESNFDTLTILGNSERFFEVIQKEKPFWIHTSTERVATKHGH